MKKNELKLNEYLSELNLTVLTDSESSPVFSGCYVCDLLSFVMSHAKQGELWLTVQTHPNIIAIAVLLELSGIVIVEGASVPIETINRANEEGVTLYQTSSRAVELVLAINDL